MTFTTTILGYLGTYWLTGCRESAWGTARFDLTLDHRDGVQEKILTNADWPTTWTELHGRMTPHHVQDTMRGVLPPN